MQGNLKSIKIKNHVYAKIKKGLFNLKWKTKYSKYKEHIRPFISNAEKTTSRTSFLNIVMTKKPGQLFLRSPTKRKVIILYPKRSTLNMKEN